MKGDKGKKIKKFFTYLIGFYFLIFGALASCGEAMAAATTTPLPKEDYQPTQVKTINPLEFTPQIKIPNTAITGTIAVGEQKGEKMVSDLLPSYIGAFYQYGLTIVGILATVILMAGGIIWLTSAGNDSKVTQAKEMIFGSLAGVFLLFSSYLILKTINPELVKLKGIESKNLDGIALDIVCCQTTSGAEMTEAKDCKGSKMTGYFPENGICIKQGCCLATLPSGDIASCKLSRKNECGVGNSNLGDTTLKVTWEEKSCANITKCKGNIYDPCEGQEDLADCGYPGNSGKCYYGHCYVGKGKVGEPCGNPKNSTSPNGSFCVDENSGDCEERDTSNLRSCDSKSICCKKVQPNGCTGKTDGTKCNTNTLKGYCYGQKCYTGKGKDGEPCGNEEGSICIDKNLGKRTCDNRDRLGGRDCEGSGNVCCEAGHWKDK